LSETLSKIIALIIAVFLLYIFPVENMLTRKDDITRVFVLNETAEFVDSVRNLGYVTPLMYLQFAQALSATGNNYDIYMEHRHGKVDPYYIDPVDITSFQHNYKVSRITVYTEDIMEVLFPVAAPASEDRYYFFSKGDYFSVRVTNRNKTTAAKVQEFLYMISVPAKRIIVNYGGMVRDETY